MASLDASNIDKPVEKIHPDNLPQAGRDDVALGLTKVVEHSADNHNVKHSLHAPMQSVLKLSWVHSLVPGIEKLAVDYHVGNYVMIRGEKVPFFESMPLYAR